MKKESVEFPICHIEGNLIFNTQGDVYAYYELNPVDYSYRSPSEKKQIRNRWVNLLRHFQQDLHLVSIPRFFDIRSYQEKLKETIPDGALHKNALMYVDRITEALEIEQKRPTEQRVFLGIKLKKVKARAKKKKVQKTFSFKLKDFARYFQHTAGIDPYDILDEELYSYQEQEQQIYHDLSGFDFVVRRATVTHLRYVIEHTAYRGITQPDLAEKWKPRTEEIEMEGQSVIRPAPKDIQNLINGEYEVSAHDICIRQVHDGEVKEGWSQFLYASYLPDDLVFPGEEWLYWLQYLSFPVDVSIRIHTIPNKKAVGMLGRQKRRLGHHVTHTRVEGQQQDLDLEEAYVETTKEEMALQRDNDPILETSISFCIYASSKKELYRRSKQFINFYNNQNKDIQLVASAGDQFLSFNEFFPGGIQYVDDFTHKLKPKMLANSMLNGSQFLGDTSGMFVGFTGHPNLPGNELDRPVFVHQSKAAQGGSSVDTKSLSMLIVGLTGYGKSYASAQLVYQAMHHLGSKVILIDAKGERGNWVTDLPGCKGQVSLTRMGADPRYQGMLDPFYLFKKEEAPLYVKDFLTQLLRVDRHHEWNHILLESIHEVKLSDHPSMNQVLEIIKSKNEQLYKNIAIHQTYPFSQLIFGNGTPPQHSLSLEKSLNIIQIDELRIPPRDKDPNHYDEIETLSKALMIPITGFVNQLVKKDRSFNQVWWEECWIPLASEAGRRAIEEGIREGRYWNSGTLLVTQNPTDLPRELVNNIGMKFIFKTKDEEQITRALEILELENLPYNRKAIQNLKEGECFFKDIYGRVGRMYFNCLFKELAQAFDTTPPLEKKRSVSQ